MKQRISVVRSLLVKAFEKKEEQKAWDTWLAIYPYMVIPQPGAKNPPLKFIPFSQFYKESVTPKKEMTADQIVIKFEEIKKRHQEKHKNLKKQ